MHASRQERTGTTGLYEVMADFTRIGWGPVPNGFHDLGTDLYIQARDDRLLDLGAVVGAQVKGGQYWFRRPERDGAGAVAGWWFYESDERHFDYWLQHGLPHLVILHDLDSRLSHWVHVTDERVQSTGQGRKILVPAEQTVDPEHLDALLAVAASGKPSITFEGSAWTGPAKGIAQDRLLRYALLAPRLVAPHVNAGFGTVIGPEQAVAVLLHQTIRYAAFSERHETVPSIEDAVSSPHWGWRFAGAIGQLVTRGVTNLLTELVETASSPYERAAAASVMSTTLMDADWHEDAIKLLTEQLDEDSVGPVDRGWMLVQRARARAEIGRVPEARADAAEAQRAMAANTSDVTASGIQGAAVRLLFVTATWHQKEVGQAVIASDTTITWWRNQAVSYGLVEALTRTFNQWTSDQTVTIGGSDIANNELLYAKLNADFMGDHQGWRSIGSLLSRYNLLAAEANHAPERGVQALDELRRSGDTKAFGLAVRRAWRSGPLEQITESAARVVANAWTHTTVATNLMLWRHGGDVLDPGTATEAASQCISFVADPSWLLTRTNQNANRQSSILDALSGLLPAADDDVHRRFVRLLAGEEGPSSQAVSISAARCVDEVRIQALDNSDRGLLLDLRPTNNTLRASHYHAGPTRPCRRLRREG